MSDTNPFSIPKREAIEITDVSNFIAEQRSNISGWQTGTLMTPAECVYTPADQRIAEWIGLDATE